MLDEPKLAGPIVAQMKRLLRRRRLGRLSRTQFLSLWSAQRELLSATDEYAVWRAVVMERTEMICAVQGCQAPGVHVHHKIPVSRAPDLALDPDNGAYVCYSHHQAIHPDIELRK